MENTNTNTMENTDLIIAKSSDNLNSRLRHQAHIIIIDNKVIKSRLNIPDSAILKLAESPEILQNLIDKDKAHFAQLAELAKEEFKPSSLNHLNSKIKIDISGISGSGKSNIALLIYDTLKLHGITTNISDEDLLYSDIELVRSKRIEILRNIGTRIGVELETKQPSKESHKNYLNPLTIN